MLRSNSTTSRKEKFHSINNYMHRWHTVVWTQRNETHSEVANKPQYPMITGPTLNESINMKIVTTRKDYRENWKFSILKEHVFHSPLEILLFNQKRCASTVNTGVVAWLLWISIKKFFKILKIICKCFYWYSVVSWNRIFLFSFDQITPDFCIYAYEFWRKKACLWLYSSSFFWLIYTFRKIKWLTYFPVKKIRFQFFFHIVL